MAATVPAFPVAEAQPEGDRSDGDVQRQGHAAARPTSPAVPGHCGPVAVAAAGASEAWQPHCPNTYSQPPSHCSQMRSTTISPPPRPPPPPSQPAPPLHPQCSADQRLQTPPSRSSPPRSFGRGSSTLFSLLAAPVATVVASRKQTSAFSPFDPVLSCPGPPKIPQSLTRGLFGTTMGLNNGQQHICSQSDLLRPRDTNTQVSAPRPFRCDPYGPPFHRPAPPALRSPSASTTRWRTRRRRSAPPRRRRTRPSAWSRTRPR